MKWERIWSIEPILFDDTLLGFCDEAIHEVAGTSHKLPSGPLHDAAEVSRAGVPTVMMFVQSLRGLSHTKLEDTQRGAPGACGERVRPARVEGDRLVGAVQLCSGCGICPARGAPRRRDGRTVVAPDL